MTLQWFENLKAQFDLNFIQRNRWRFITTGLGNTLLITLFSLAGAITTVTIYKKHNAK